jgi:hypothetical protein
LVEEVERVEEVESVKGKVTMRGGGGVNAEC